MSASAPRLGLDGPSSDESEITCIETELGEFLTTPRASRGSAARPGTKLGRYILMRELGAGGMGVVYEAFDPQRERRAALKMLHRRSTPRDRGHEERKRFGERLIREGQGDKDEVLQFNRKTLELSVPVTEATEIQKNGMRFRVARLLAERGEVDAARATIEDLPERADRMIAPWYSGRRHAARAAIARAEGDLEGALFEAESRLASDSSGMALPPKHLRFAEQHIELAAILRDLGQWARAATHIDIADTAITRALGPDHHRRFEVACARGEWALARGDAHAAREAFEGAWTLFNGHEMREHRLAETIYGLARAHQMLAADDAKPPALVNDLMHTAQLHFEARGSFGHSKLREIRAWRARSAQRR